MTHQEGYRWTEPGRIANATCKVCGAACNIDRNVLGPTNHAAAIAGRKQLHDQVWCPSSGAPWHNQAVELRRQIALTPSPTLAAILGGDLNALLATLAPQST